MILLPKSRILAAYDARRPMQHHLEPLQAQMGGDPWKVMVASMLLCRTKRGQAEPCFDELLRRWPGPEALARAYESEVEAVVKPCGLHRQRARQLIRSSVMWFSEYDDLREFPGVGLYVADAVGLFCFGCTDLCCTDHVLAAYAAKLKHLKLDLLPSGQLYGQGVIDCAP
jgi:endonuclease III